MAGLSARRIAALLAIPVVLIGCAVLVTATIERDAALRAGYQQAAAQDLLTAMLDQETGARGYFETGQVRFLAPWYSGRTDFATALAQSRALAAGDAPLLVTLSEQARRAASWQQAIAAEIAQQHAGAGRPTVASAVAAKDAMDDFRQLNAGFDAQLTSRRNHALSRATWFAVGLAVGLSIVLALTGIVLMRHANRIQVRRLRRQQELRELLQVSSSEEESQLLLIRHVERSVPGSAAAVFNRNNSDDRLEPRLSERAAETPLRSLSTERLTPRSCMAVRLSRAYGRSQREEPLLPCEACGKIAADVLCEPLLVGGQVIGAVLVVRDGAIKGEERDRLRDSVVQAAPILANQRHLAVAERRAASDALTGLPNRRAADETLKRMVAQAGRTVTPLSVILFDLDHFKQVNDVHGHEQGDKALAAIGQVLTATLRASDFAARYGGEEFLVTLPDTSGAMAYTLAEKLRRGIERTEIAGVGSITASFGIASLPDDAAEPEYLLRKADRALYAAKAGGRNRVELTPGVLHEPGGNV